MHGYKEPGFQERTAAAAKARDAALETLRNRPKMSAEETERRIAAQARQDAVAAEKQAAARQAREDAAAAKRDSKREIAQVAAASKGASESERKAARDARYASRKQRKG